MRTALAAALLGAVTFANPAAPPSDVTVVELAPLIWSVKGPAKTGWEHCLFLLAGRPRGRPAPELSTLCQVDGKLAGSVLAPVHPSSQVVAVEAGPIGGLRVLVGRSGGIDEIRLDAPGAAPRSVTLIEDVALDPRSLGDRPDLDGDGRDDLVQATFEGVSLWRREEDGRMTRRPGQRLPPEASLDGEWLTVRGKYLVEPVPPSPLRWTWPETLAGKRLKTYRVPLDPAAGNPCAAWIDTEAQVGVSKAVFLSGEPPRMVALARPADKVALFGNLTLLVVPLACDETARGQRPAQRMLTEFDSNFGWTGLEVKDVNEDGNKDILIVGRQGLVNEKLQVAVYPGLADGSFAGKPVSGVRSNLDPLASRWEDDVDADGRDDLIVLDRARVLVAPGVKVRGPNDLPFDLRKPALLTLPESFKPRFLLEPVDFDGDGRLEVVIGGEERKEEKGRSAQPDTRLAIVRVPAGSR